MTGNTHKGQHQINESTDIVRPTRRSFISGTTALAVSPLFSKSVLASQGGACTISGFQSVNPSGVARHARSCGGFSQGAWGNPYSGNGDGNITQWRDAGLWFSGQLSSKGWPFTHPSPSGIHMGFVPDPPSHNSSVQQSGMEDLFKNTYHVTSVDDIQPTAWATVFGPEFFDDDVTIHQVLTPSLGYGDSLDRDAAAALLSVCWLKFRGETSPLIHPFDIINLYRAARLVGAGHMLTTINGSRIRSMSVSDTQTFFVQLQY